MDLGLGEQQEMLRRAARQFLEDGCPTALVRELEDSDIGYSPELWKSMADLGWLGLGLPGEYGGAGGSLVDQVVLFEEIGRAILPSPIFPSTVLCGQTLLRTASEEQKLQLLPRVVAGDLIMTLAPEDAPGGPEEERLDIVAAADGDYVINGTRLFVPYAHVADYILYVSGPTDIFMVDTTSPGVTVTIMESVASYKQHEIAFQGVRVPRENVLEGAGQGQMESAIQWATVVQCAEMVGRGQKVLDMVVEYSKVRVQFGRPIGGFQAIQHRCADLRVAVDGARLLTYQAAWRLTEGLPCSEDISMAKAFAGSLSRQAAAAGHAIFAGIAFTAEHDMQLYTMRSKIAEASLGDTDFHLDRVGEYLAS